MVKQVSTKTLDDVVRELKAQNKTLQQQLDVEKTTLQEQIQTRMDALGQQAQRFRESVSNTVAGAQAAANNVIAGNRIQAGASRVGGKFAGPAAMAAFSASSTAITTMISAVSAFGLQIMKHFDKLKNVAKLVRIGAFALGLPALIAFIADGIWARPAFKELLETTGNVLKNDVWPALQKLTETLVGIATFFVGVGLAIGKAVLDVMTSDTAKAAFGAVSEAITNIQNSLQDLVLGLVTHIVGLVGLVSNVIEQALSGDFTGAFRTLMDGIVDSAYSLINLTLTEFVQAFLPDAFGENGTLFGSIKDAITSLADSVKQGFIDFKDMVVGLWDVYIVGGAVNFLAAIMNMRDKIRDGFTSFGEEVVIQWDNMIAFFTDPTREGSIPYTFIAAKTAISNGWNSFMTVLTVDVPAKLTEIKDGILETAGTIVKSLYITPIENAIKFVMGMFGFDPEEVADFSLIDTVKDNAKLIKDIIINAFQNAVTFLNFLPDELGLMLKEKYIKLKFMFLEKLQSFMNVFSGIIPGLKVEAMNVIRNMPFGKQIIGDATYAAALQEKNAALGGNSSAITAIRADRDSQLEALAIERIRLEAARQQLRADGGVGGTSVNNSQTTNSVTILNQSQPVPDDPIALRYAGPNVPVI